MLNNENIWTQGGEQHTLGPVRRWGARSTISRWKNRGGIALGEIPNVDDGVMDAASQHGTFIPM